MARVYERPRYIDQAQHRLLALATHTGDHKLKMATGRALGVSDFKLSTLEYDYENLAQLDIEDDIDNHVSFPVDDQLADYLLDSQVGAELGGFVLSRPEAAAFFINDYLATHKHHKPKYTLCDEQAMFHILAKCLKDQRSLPENKVDMQARIAAERLISWQLPGQKVSPAQFSGAFRGTILSGGSNHLAVVADKWLDVAENLQYRSQPMWVKYSRLAAARPRRLNERTAAMVDKAAAAKPYERHIFYPFSDSGIEATAYNYAGIIVIYMGEHQLVIDNASASYLRTAITALRNARYAFAVLRVAGDSGKTNYSSDFERCVNWISDAISQPTNARYVARHMHLWYTRWQNKVGEEGADIDCDWEKRDPILAKEAMEYYPYNESWWHLVNSIDCPERVRAEFFKLYHLLPPPDIDPLLLHNTVIANTTSANYAQPAAILDFIKFCKAYDFCRFVAKNHKLPNFAVDKDYVFEETGWLKSCKRGKLKLPPKSEWGKVWIHKEFPYPHTGDFHVLAAKDSTRVVADKDKYMNRMRQINKHDNNELLSALFNGSVLSNGETMEVWRDRVMTGNLTKKDVVIGAEAGKAENTKPGKKVRETLSACDTVREFLSEVDHSLRPLAEMTPGVSLRMSMIRHKKKFQEMARSVSRDSTKRAFATSTDVTGWSPKMSRAMHHAWQDYALGTTECDNPKAPRALWSKLELFCDRRGVKRCAPCTNGTIQGWQATSDTTMHAHILIYWVFMLRERGILSDGEAAYTLCLIDDVATTVVVDGTDKECKDKAAMARDLMVEVYASLGFAMDVVKSFFSSVKFVYLNELYVDGSQVGTGTKTMMRIDRDHTRRFATLTDNIATAYGTAAAAAGQGADPFVAYWIATTLSLRWAFKKEPRLMKLSSTELMMVALLPASLNGLGIRPITAVFSTGVVDALVWYIEIMGPIVNDLGSDTDKRVFTALLEQPTRSPSAVACATNPFGYSAATHQDATRAIAERFKKAASDKGLAEPFLSLSQIEKDDKLEECWDAILKAGSYEASLLEEVTSNMPTAFIDQVMARVEKTEIVAYLLGSRGIGSLRRLIDACERNNLHVVYSLIEGTRFDLSVKDIGRVIFGTLKGVRNGGDSMLPEDQGIGPYAWVHAQRNKLYKSLQYDILNHTYPCPFSLWAFHGPVDLELESSRRLTTVSFDMKRLRRTVASKTTNMYDSATRELGYRGYMSSRANVANEIRVALYDPVRRMVASGLAAFRWARASGAHYKNVLDLFLWSWGGVIDERLEMLPGAQLSGNPKKLSLRHNKANHAVLMFHNVQSAVKVDARAVTVAQANKSHMYDMMTAITTLRCAGMLEAALRIRTGQGGFAYGFGYLENASAQTVVPLHEEELISLEYVYKLKPFNAIESPMKRSAVAVCSYNGMATVLAIYAAAGDKAASKAFQSLVEDGTIEGNLVSQHDQEFLGISEPRMVGERVREEWLTRSTRPHGLKGDIVQEPGKIKVAQSFVEMPTGTTDDHLNRISKAYDDTILLDLALTNSRLLEDLRLLSGRGIAVEVLEREDWLTESKRIMPTDRHIRSIIGEVEGVVGKEHTRQHLPKVFRQMGLPGLRSHASSTDGDDVQWVKSFIGTTAATIARAAHVGKAANRFRRGTSERYSSVAVAEAGNAKRTLVKVVKAQWSAAAARREKRAAQNARMTGSGYSSVQDNYEAQYLRCAVEHVGHKGDFFKEQFLRSCITKTINSLSKFVGNGDPSDDYEEMLDQVPMEFEKQTNDTVETELALTTAANVAATLNPAVNIDAIVDAFRNMLAWLRSDLEGDHQISPVVTRKVHRSVASTNVAAFASAPMGSVGSTSRAAEVTIERIVPEPIIAKPATPEPVEVEHAVEIQLREAIIGEAPVEYGELEDIGAAELAEWITDNQDAREWLFKEFSDRNIHSMYKKWTKSKVLFYSTAKRCIDDNDLGEFEEPDMSMFPSVDFDDDDDEVVQD